MVFELGRPLSSVASKTLAMPRRRGCIGGVFYAPIVTAAPFIWAVGKGDVPLTLKLRAMARDNINWLPESGTERRVAPLPTDNRAAQRFSYRALVTAIIHPPVSIGGETQHCYVPTRDLSQTGISFIHPKKLVTGQRIEMTFQDGREVEVKVQRFRQLGPRCFLIGCKFSVVPDSDDKKRLAELNRNR